MNVNKHILIGVGIFLLLVFLALGISTRFEFSTIVDEPNDPYQFIEDFFDQWSPALSAAGAVIVAVIALVAIYEGRRTHRQTIRERLFTEIKEWAEDERALLYAILSWTSKQHTKISDDELVKLSSQVSHGRIIIVDAAQTLADYNLIQAVDSHMKLRREMHQVLIEGDRDNISKSVDELIHDLDNILRVIGDVHKKMLD